MDFYGRMEKKKKRGRDGWGNKRTFLGLPPPKNCSYSLKNLSKNTPEIQKTIKQRDLFWVFMHIDLEFG